jgi:hypothetical protein
VPKATFCSSCVGSVPKRYREQEGVWVSSRNRHSAYGVIYFTKQLFCRIVTSRIKPLQGAEPAIIRNQIWIDRSWNMSELTFYNNLLIDIKQRYFSKRNRMEGKYYKRD